MEPCKWLVHAYKGLDTISFNFNKTKSLWNLKLIVGIIDCLFSFLARDDGMDTIYFSLF
jgi:hypothetical protein